MSEYVLIVMDAGGDAEQRNPEVNFTKAPHLYLELFEWMLVFFIDCFRVKKVSILWVWSFVQCVSEFECPVWSAVNTHGTRITMTMNGIQYKVKHMLISSSDKSVGSIFTINFAFSIFLVLLRDFETIFRVFFADWRIDEEVTFFQISISGV